MDGGLPKGWSVCTCGFMMPLRISGCEFDTATCYAQRLRRQLFTGNADGMILKSFSDEFSQSISQPR